MTVDDIIKLISTVGFPILVAGYVLMRLETTQQKILEVLNRIEALFEDKSK